MRFPQETLPHPQHDDNRIDVAVAQMLDLARLANVEFQLSDDRLILQSARMDRRYWPAVRKCLDEIGVPVIADYFRRTTPQQRARLAAPA